MAECAPVDAALLSALRARSPDIRRRWEVLLRRERVTSPLANPDALVYLIPITLEQVAQALERSRARPLLSAVREIPRAPCSCGCNPYLGYFRAGEQALLEALAEVQDGTARLAGREAVVAEFNTVVRRLANDEIKCFCSICTHRGQTRGCRFIPASSVPSLQAVPAA